MPNFDALRPAISGPLSYLCKPQKPTSLLGCWPLAGGSFDDVSVYGGGSNLSSLTTSLNTSYGFPLIFVNSQITFYFSLGKSLDPTQDWSLDWTFLINGGYGAGALMSIGGLVFNMTAAGWYSGFSLDLGGTSLYSTGNVIKPQNVLYHIAIVYDSYAGKIRIFQNGSKQTEVQQSLSSMSEVGSLSSTLNVSYGTNPSFGFSNVRVVQKCVGTDISYPTPTSLYTGYEAL